MLFTGRSFAPPFPRDITSTMIADQVIPSEYVSTTYAGYANNPWNNGSPTPNTGFRIWAMNARGFRVSFYGPTNSGCASLLTTATACEIGQTGCPTKVYTNQSNEWCVPNQPGCIGAAAAGGPGWASMGIAGAEHICGYNRVNQGSVEFDYTL